MTRFTLYDRICLRDREKASDRIVHGTLQHGTVYAFLEINDYKAYGLTKHIRSETSECMELIQMGGCMK